MSTVVTLLAAPAQGETPVTVTSSNPSVATATASTILAGQQTTTLSIDALADGQTVLTLRAGDEVRSVTVFVGAVAPGQTPIVVAPTVGVSLPRLPYGGQTAVAPATTATFGLVLLPAPRASDTAVTVISSNPAVAQVLTPSVQIPAGSRVAQLQVSTGTTGTTRLVLEIDGQPQEYILFVGTPAATSTPVAPAAPVGVSIVPDPGASSGSRIVAPAGTVLTPSLGVQLLTTPRAGAVQVTVTTSDPSIVSVGAGTTAVLTLEAGSLVLPTTFTTLGIEGAAVLSFEFDGLLRELLIVVGNPPASQLPAVVAAPVCVTTDATQPCRPGA